MADVTSFDTVLVANRGEIAARIFATARTLGLRTVAVYSDADRDAPYVRSADEAVRLGPAPASQSYLSIPAVLAAARRTGANAIHPGYGFLAESAAFARAVEDAGLVFVGPPSSVIEELGRKDNARRIAVDAGVPVLTVGGDVGGDLGGDLTAAAGPLLVKAVAGGGGKGMRIVHDVADLPAVLATARREAQAAFGDPAVLVERYLPAGRHVEVQVLADAHGTVVHLGERDCSTQRRHQKVIEEAPAPNLPAHVRRTVTQAAVALCRAAGYRNAGTVEFLVHEDEAYFLEVNTRLQVEHAVTELVTGVDLVAMQFAIADGQPLPFAQADIRWSGHAIEARVYAEDAFGGFLPQAGTADLVRWPRRARVDADLESGQVVGTDYDPMLGKITVHRSTRPAARVALVDAIDDTAILGVTTNLGFVRAVLESATFRDGEVRTSWLDGGLAALTPTGRAVAAAVAGWALARDGRSDRGGPFAVGDGWRLAGPPATVAVERTDGGPDVRVVGADGPVVRVEVDGALRTAVAIVRPDQVVVSFQGSVFAFARPDRFDPARHAHDDDGTVVAPMPGIVVAVSAAVGDVVEVGAVLGVLEAMKMQLPLRAGTAGVVTRASATVARQVALGDVLFEIGATDDALP